MVLIIAEAGVNHNGSMEIAKELIREAKEAGADYVKFQTFKSELNISPKAAKADYQVTNTGNDESQLDMIKKLEFSQNQFLELSEYCKECGIGFLSTAFDPPSLAFINELQELHKIPSGEIVNLPYLRLIASCAKPVIMSTGMAEVTEIKAAMQVLQDGGLSEDQITILHCNTEYPTPYEDVNLHAMNDIRDKMGVEVGYSDHTLGIEVPIAAVALGATVIEKHFTLDRTMQGPDHIASLEPHQLRNMVSAIRNIEKAISGSGVKERSISESKNLEIARKSVHLAVDMRRGQTIKESDLLTLRPGSGISPMEWDKLVGAELKKDLEAGTMLTWDDIK